MVLEATRPDWLLDFLHASASKDHLTTSLAQVLSPQQHCNFVRVRLQRSSNFAANSNAAILLLIGRKSFVWAYLWVQPSRSCGYLADIYDASERPFKNSVLAHVNFEEKIVLCGISFFLCLGCPRKSQLLISNSQSLGLVPTLLAQWTQHSLPLWCMYTLVPSWLTFPQYIRSIFRHPISLYLRLVIAFSWLLETCWDPSCCRHARLDFWLQQMQSQNIWQRWDGIRCALYHFCNLESDLEALPTCLDNYSSMIVMQGTDIGDKGNLYMRRSILCRACHLKCCDGIVEVHHSIVVTVSRDKRSFESLKLHLILIARCQHLSFALHFCCCQLIRKPRFAVLMLF